MRILIAVPTYETIAPETFKAIYNLKTGSEEVSFDFVKGYDCAEARNRIGEKTVQGGYDHVLMIDSDVVVPENALMDMLEFPADIVLGCYPRKNAKDRTTELYKAGQNDFVERYSYDELQETRIRIKGGGMGCALIDTRTFIQMSFPWFQYVVYDNNEKLSEDLYFCSEAERIGLKIEADTRVRCGHLVRYFQYE